MNGGSANTDTNIDVLTCQMTLILFTNPLAAPVYLLALIKDQMCADILGKLDKMATSKIADLENTLVEMFQLHSPDVYTSAGTDKPANEPTTTLFRDWDRPVEKKCRTCPNNDYTIRR